MLIMEFTTHGSLHDLLHNSTLIFEGDMLLHILQDIIQGMRFLHSPSPHIIHGDLKASNVLVDSKFRAKVTDFGLSQKKTLNLMKSQYWRAPELLRWECDRNDKTDVYSFGITLYEVYSRQDPYEGEGRHEVLRQVSDPAINKRPPIPSGAPPLIKSVMIDCLLADPSKRPTFSELHGRFKQLEGRSIEPTNLLLTSHQRMELNKSIRTDELLFDIFPRHIAEALRDRKEISPESRDCVTIFFSDIVGFTNISATLSPLKVSNMLDRLYSRFDALLQKYAVFKVETIGDAYMAVTNLVIDQRNDHVRHIVDFAIAAVSAASETLIDEEDETRGVVSIRVGFHCGPVVASVVGSRNPRYCLFGDTVNTASRMESTSIVGRIQCSEQAAALLRVQYPEMKMSCRGRIPIKGKGRMRTYWVNEEPDMARHSISVRTGSTNSSIRNGRSSSVKSQSFSIRKKLPSPVKRSSSCE